MICTRLRKRTKVCGNVQGGLAEIGFFDPNDLRFISGVADSDGGKTGYSSFVARPNATGDLVFLVTFLEGQAELTWKQTVNGCSVKYTHELIFQIAENDQTMANLLEAYDAAGCCCGLAFFARYNNKRIVVAGEKYVDDDTIPKFTMKQSGSDGTSGKLFDDFNGGNIHILGDYGRPLYEYKGTWASVLAFAGDDTAGGDTAVYDNVIEFDTDPAGVATKGSTQGLSFNFGTEVNPNRKFEFNTVTSGSPTPGRMDISVGGDPEGFVNILGRYASQPFRYTDGAGVSHTDVITDPEVDF